MNPMHISHKDLPAARASSNLASIQKYGKPIPETIQKGYHYCGVIFRDKNGKPVDPQLNLW